MHSYVKLQYRPIIDKPFFRAPQQELKGVGKNKIGISVSILSVTLLSRGHAFTFETGGEATKCTVEVCACVLIFKPVFSNSVLYFLQYSPSDSMWF